MADGAPRRGCKSGRSLHVADLGDGYRERFWSKVDRSGGQSACWPWRGALQANGYGRVKAGRRAVLAHRVAYVLLEGEAGADLVIDHRCRTRSCCNPLHLEAVTQQTNVLRGEAPNAVIARAGVCSHGHAFTAGRDCLPCAARRKREYRARRASAIASACILGVVSGLALATALMPRAVFAVALLLAGGASS